MNRPKNKISKENFLKLNEDDIMFITNPGRMGDEDGSTFVVKEGNKLVIYRIDGWMYYNKDLNDDKFISLDDAAKQFPKWMETWKNNNNENDKEKYKYLYMGFGNGLSVDYSIYNDFEPFLSKSVKEYLKDKKGEKESLKYAAIYNVWEKALIEMMKEKRM
ncbi:MAG: hypothetical protein IJI60_02170 [Bacilli bacterium]|nr:hypothetical protein [Bacilli bacterium]